ncbi:MAG: DUF481 domain-containing protein [Gemmatimonadales bacterium]|nr:MAG: DUF481 domain-containing protein [Gemmatimonadales bacterium]
MSTRAGRRTRSGSPWRRSAPERGPFLLLVLLVGLLLPGLPEAASAQSGSWRVQSELGGSFFFGNREQTTFSTRTQVERADELFESSTDLRFNYGEAPNSDGDRVVTRRSWTADASLDFRPQDRWRPFVSGHMQSSFERRIALRYDAGAGLRVNWDRDRRNRVGFSLSILAERTYAREGGRDTPDEVSLTRWSSNLRVRRAYFDGRFTLDTNNSYQPVFDSFGNFNLSTRNSFTVSLTEIIGLRLSARAEYDSGARDRGADTNRDGSVQVTLVGRF